MKLMARTLRIKPDKDTRYHLMSRINNKMFLFKQASIKRDIVKTLKKVAYFSGIEINAYCIMDDHFHIVCTVRRMDKKLSEEEILKRIAVLKGRKYAKSTAEDWAYNRSLGLEREVENNISAWQDRMNDISQMMKTFKENVDRIYKKEHKYVGTIFTGRFKSTIIEDGKYFAVCVKYVELNPVRAKMVRMAKDYEFSSYNERNANKDGLYAGPGPEERELVKRVPQIGNGVVFGSYEFVRGKIKEGIGKKPRHVLCDMFATHGHKLSLQAEVVA